MNIENPDLIPEEEETPVPRPSFTVEVVINDPEWEAAADFPLKDIAEITVRETLFCAEFTPDDGSEICIMLANDALIQTLNREYREKDSPTNVLSFTYENHGKDEPLGDIVLARETILREAEEQMKTLREHFIHLLVHGTLHLLGYDHEEEEEAENMENTEIWILQRLGVKNPYLTMDKV